MEESFRQVGYDVGQILFPAYLIFAFIFVFIAIITSDNKQRSTSFWFSAAGFVLSVLMNLPTPWNQLPLIWLMLIGSVVAYRYNPNATKSKIRNNAIFAALAMIGIPIYLWNSPGGSFTIEESQVTQFDYPGNIRGTFPKETQFKIRAFRSSSNTYLLWSVSDNKDFYKRPLSLTTKEIYWNRKYGFINGDQLALRIAEWAETPVEVGDWVNKVPEKTTP